MASSTTLGKIALVTGPAWWGDNWVARSGRHVRGRDREAHTQRVAEAAAETAGLTHELDQLPADVALLLVGTSGATRLASRWADDHVRITVRVPANIVQTAAAEDLAVAIALAMGRAGRLVKALACVPTPADPVIEALRARGLVVRPVVPLYPDPEVTEEAGPTATGTTD